MLCTEQERRRGNTPRGLDLFAEDTGLHWHELHRDDSEEWCTLEGTWCTDGARAALAARRSVVSHECRRVYWRWQERVPSVARDRSAPNGPVLGAGGGSGAGGPDQRAAGGVSCRDGPGLSDDRSQSLSARPSLSVEGGA
jgi:hypothetical protein